MRSRCARRFDECLVLLTHLNEIDFNEDQLFAAIAAVTVPDQAIWALMAAHDTEQVTPVLKSNPTSPAARGGAGLSFPLRAGAAGVAGGGGGGDGGVASRDVATGGGEQPSPLPPVHSLDDLISQAERTVV